MGCTCCAMLVSSCARCCSMPCTETSTSERTLHSVGYSRVPTAIRVLVQRRRFLEVFVAGRERYSCSKRRTARGDRSPTGGVAGSSMVASGVGCDRPTSTRVVVARPFFWFPRFSFVEFVIRFSSKPNAHNLTTVQRFQRQLYYPM